VQDNLKEMANYCEMIAAYFRRKLGASVRDVYKLGSLAHGGFSPVYSDIDVCVLLNCPEPPEEMGEFISDAKEIDPTHGKRLSVFWGNPDHAWGRLPVLDRVDLIDHGVPLLSASRADLERPDKASVRQALLQSVANSWEPHTKELLGIAELKQENRKPFIRCLLYPARLIYTWDRLEIASNDRAVEYLEEIKPADLDLQPIRLALECRHERYTAEQIFARDVNLAAQFNAATSYIDKH
jgi:predicted nucleotidyltransferase